MPFLKGSCAQYRNPTGPWPGAPPAEVTARTVISLLLSLWGRSGLKWLTDHGEDDHDDPTELDGGTNDFDFAKYVDPEDVDENNDHPKYRDPR